MSTGSLSHGSTFETIEGLLEIESPKWGIKRMETLIARLSHFAGVDEENA